MAQTLKDLLTDEIGKSAVTDEFSDEELYIRIGRNKILDAIAEDFGLPVTEWGISEWKAIAQTILTEKVELGLRHDAAKWANSEMVAELMRRIRHDKDRIKNRPDQVDKRAFQEAVKANIDSYTVKAEAIRDLRIKPQFEQYPDTTLRDWLKDIWDKPIKSGRPKKAKK